MSFLVDNCAAEQDFVYILVQGVNAVLALLDFACVCGCIWCVGIWRFRNGFGIGGWNGVAIDRKVRLNLWATRIVLNSWGCLPRRDGGSLRCCGGCGLSDGAQSGGAKQGSKDHAVAVGAAG
jgi:hypothetical protein